MLFLINSTKVHSEKYYRYFIFGKEKIRLQAGC